MSHAFTTLAFPIPTNARLAVEAALLPLENPASDRLRTALDGTGIVHFLAMAIVDGDMGGSDYLIIEMSSDGTTDDAIALLTSSDALSPLVAPVFRALEVEPTSEQLADRRITVGSGWGDIPGLEFSGTPGLSVSRIRREAALADALRDVVAAAPSVASPKEAVARLRTAVAEDPGFDGLRDLLESAEPVPFLAPRRSPKLTAKLGFQMFRAATRKLLWPVFLIAALIAIYRVSLDFADQSLLASAFGAIWRFVIWSLLLVALSYGVIFVLLRRREANEGPDASLPDPVRLNAVRAREDLMGAQNHLFGVSRMKPGLLRMYLLRVAFTLIGFVAQRLYRPGFLSNIGTIHFARWFRLPGTDKLIFCSNYGGSWESYLEDFITKAPLGLTAIWSNTVGFPPSKFFFGEGARQADLFKRWARRQQYPTRVWYSAYPDLTTGRIRKNGAIRHGLVSACTEDEAQAVMALFGGRPRPAGTLEKPEIQSLVLSGLGRYRQSACLLLELPQNGEKARNWLAAASGTVGFGEPWERQRVDQIGLSARGLERLGQASNLAGFPYVFTEGMEARANVLGDVAGDAPANWEWGAGEDRVDAVQMIYMSGPKSETPERLQAKLETAVKEAEATIKKADGRVIRSILTVHLDDPKRRPVPDGPAREVFGFADGISQPRIRGLRPDKPAADPQHDLAPGEFILGYPDNRGQRHISVNVPANQDLSQMLPVAGVDHGLTPEPEMAESGVNAPRDLSRNGSYLVIRQLGQDRKAFDEYLNASAENWIAQRLAPEGLDPNQVAHLIGAKMVGRWKDGSSLVAYPRKPASGWSDASADTVPDNAFLLGRDDPAGLACPFGAHIRRANPRESFDPGSENQMNITNRHRILRRGRFFRDGTATDPAKAEGLLFVCANADIERQFEFVQQTWLMAPQFHGTHDEVDPLFSGGGKYNRMAVPMGHGTAYLRDIPDFVQTMGGEYFFLPSKAALRFLADGPPG